MCFNKKKKLKYFSNKFKKKISFISAVPGWSLSINEIFNIFLKIK